jgi:hypothetical protein
MTLPSGVTCEGCVYFAHCKRMYSVTAERTVCDFFPRRYAARAQDAQKGGEK